MKERNSEVMKWVRALLATLGQKTTLSPSLRTHQNVHIFPVHILKLHRVERAT